MLFDPVLEEDLVESWAVNELQVEERCSELEERGLVECFGVGVSDHVLGADPDWDGEEREKFKRNCSRPMCIQRSKCLFLAVAPMLR